MQYWFRVNLVRIIENKLGIRPGKISLVQIKRITYINLKENAERYFSGTSRKHYSPNKNIFKYKKTRKQLSLFKFWKKHKKEFRNLRKRGV